MIKLDTAESDILLFSSFSKPRSDITQHATKPLSDITEDSLSDHEPLPVELRKVLYSFFSTYAVTLPKTCKHTCIMCPIGYPLSHSFPLDNLAVFNI